jgi:hypothetical protein
MTDKDFWLLIRQALLTMVRAIERKYKLGDYSKGEVIETDDNDTVTTTLG